MGCTHRLRRIAENAPLVAFVLTLLGAVLRFAFIGQEALWADEFYSVLSGSGETIAEVMRRVDTWDPHPPFYFLALHFWMMPFGQSDVSIRVFGAIPMTFAVPVFYLAARRLLPGSPLAATAAGFLFVVSPYQIWYAQEARPYPWLASLVVFALYGSVRMLEAASDDRTPRPWETALLAVPLLLGVLTHYHAYFAGFGIGLPVLIAAIRGTKPFRLHAAAALGVPMAGVLYALPKGLFLIREGRGIEWLPGLSFEHVDDILRAQVVGPLYAPMPDWAVLLGVLAGAVLLVLGAVNAGKFGTRELKTLLLAGFLSTLAIPIIVTLTLRPVMLLGQRYLIIACPYFVLLLAAAFANPRRSVRIVSAVSTVVLLLLQTVWLADYYRFRQKHVWDTATARIAELAEPSRPIVVFPPRHAAMVARYVTDGRTVSGIELEEIPVRIAESADTPPILVSIADLSGDLAAAGVDPARVSTGILECHRPGQIIYVYMVAPR